VRRKQPKDDLAFVGRSLWSAADRAFITFLAGSLFVHCSAILAINHHQTPPADEEVPRSIPFHAWHPTIAPPTSPSPHARAGSGEPDRVARKQPASKQEGLAESVNRSLRWIGADAPGSGPSVADVLFGGSEAKTIQAALEGAHGKASVAFAPMRQIDLGNGASTVATPTTRGSRDISIDGDGAIRHRPRVTVEDGPTGPAGCNSATVAAVVKRNLRALSMCYERELAHYPDLQGKLTVRIEIAATGKVNDVEIEEDSLHSGAVASCVQRFIRIWVFPALGTACPVVYPLVFVPVR
jgi:outer membrane biosynthesis protein TonB